MKFKGGHGVGLQLAPGNAANSFSWNQYWTNMIPMPLLAYGTSETNIALSVTDVFSGKAKMAWYGSDDGVTYSKLSTTGKGIVAYNFATSAGNIS